MVPLVVLGAAFGLTLLVTARRSARRRPDVVTALRVGIAVMFVVSGVSHFVGMREQMIAMVPDALPFPAVIVTLTGLLELAAAVAMLSRRLTPWAAAGLTLLLIAMFPANVDLALTGTDLTWTQTLVPRTIIQVVYLAATATLAVLTFRRSTAGARGQAQRRAALQAPEVRS
ncbi:DoxX family membrane protein [Herbiconiux sp. P15]|uniref:DoxX family protein n=1 Tax=Herbiconiux liukaitaii TaxID=3342799 RepID=UPI0035B82F35